ncbi:MAG: hypothetical protein LUE17_12660 [Planctomycetaceae bacterium]|nr:hypothetical protein [Planctomycetaceae bacterium]
MATEHKAARPAYTEVWGDTVVITELLAASVICIAATMIFYFIGNSIFLGREGMETGLAKGYSLLIGILGCILSAIVCAKLYKPKRVVEERLEQEDILHVLEAAGITPEEEAEALAVADPQIIREMEELELYSLLAMIPEGSPNYKPEYKQKSEGI